MYWSQIVPWLLHISWGRPATTTWTQSFSPAGVKCCWDWKYPECATEYLLPQPKQMWHSWRLNRAVECEYHLLFDSAYLQHDRADVSYTLSDGLWSAGDCDSPLCRVRQHVSCHLNLSACGLNITRQQKKQRLFIAEKSTLSPKLKHCFKHPQITPNTFWHAGSSCKPNTNVRSNIWRGIHKYCPFRMRFTLHRSWQFISGIFRSSNRTHINTYKYTNIKAEKNKKSLTGVFDTWGVRAPGRMSSVPIWEQKNNSLLEKKKEKDPYLSDLFDLWASLANKWATLAPWENQAKCHRWLACHVAVCHCCGNILRENSEICFSAPTVRTSALFDKSLFLWDWGKGAFSVLQTKSLLYLLKLLCDHGESSEEALCGSCDGHYSLRRWSLWYVDTGTTLETQIHYYSSLNLL